MNDPEDDAHASLLFRDDVDPDATLLDRFWTLWETVFPSMRSDPYTQARRDLADAYHSLAHAIRTHNARMSTIYDNFFAHVQAGRDPQLDHFHAVVTWYKRIGDEMHALAAKLLTMHAVAKDNPAQFVAVWEPMPAEIQRSRAKWAQRYTPDNVSKRDVETAFVVPKRARGVPVDCETDYEY